MMNSLKLQPAVSFFPTPLPDELLDSIIYRYHRLSGNSHPKNTIQIFYGDQGSHVPKLLTNGIRCLHARLPRGIFASTDELIHEVTMVPAFGAVLDAGQMESVHHASLDIRPFGQNVQYRSLTRVMHSALHCCPMCVREEMEQIGVAYWHRSHQLHGVKVCHRHGCDLISSCPCCDEPIAPKGTMALPGSYCAGCGKPLFAVFSHPEAVKEIAILGSQALSGLVPFCDRRWLGEKIRSVVGADTQSVCDSATRILGARYLEEMDDPFYSFSGDWLGHGFRSRNTIHGLQRGWLNLPSLMHMMVLVHVLFGRWDEVIAPRAQMTRAA